MPSCSAVGMINCANKAGTLVFLRLVFADEMAGSQKPLLALGGVSLVGQAALTTPEQRRQALKQLRQRTSAVPQRFRRAAAEVATGEHVCIASAFCVCNMMQRIYCIETMYCSLFETASMKIKHRHQHHPGGTCLLQ